MLVNMRVRIITLFVLCLFTGLTLSGQDIIIKKNGEEIQALIIDVSPGVIKYKKFDNQQGPIFAIAREQVDKIVYQSGKSRDFEEEEPEEIKKPDENLQRKMPLSPSPLFGFHMGLGGSNLYGDIEGNKTLFASTIGASFNLPIGNRFSLLFGLDILSVGCGFEDVDFINEDTTHIIITGAREDLGYINIVILPRVYLNPKRNYFLEGGFYGAFLLTATYSGEAEITYSSGQVESGLFEDDELQYYNTFDYGIAGGVGGRIPLGQKGKWHINVGARFYYGLANILNSSYFIEDAKVSNIYGLIFIGVDLQTKTK
jgi:hypothetical protein